MAGSPAVARALLGFARKFARDRGIVAEEEMTRLRRDGYTDGQAGEIAADVALNPFTNDFDHRAATASVLAIMDRDNETWLAHLRGPGPEQQTALSDLREALLRGLRRAVSHRALADYAFLEDVAQDALVRILERLPQFEGRSRFPTWAMSIAIRVALSALRRRRWKDVSLDEAVAGADFPAGRALDDDPGPGARSEREAILDAMHRLIRDGLTERQRAALLAELRGMPQDEIARHLGSNRNALYKLTHDARKRLKRGLEMAGFTAEDIGDAFAG